MKQQLSKLLGRFKRNGRKEKTSVPRITNETLAEDREAVISQGKRYKYPVQQTKKRTIIISSVIVALLIVGTAAFTWWQLYRAQSTSQFIYRVTQIFPLPVGKVAGEVVLYSDYLTKLRSSLHYLTTKEAVNLASDNGQRQLAYQKRQAMDKVLEQAFVRTLARENDVSVSGQEVTDFIEKQIQTNDIGATKEDFKTVIREYYGWTFDQYRQSIKAELLKQKVKAAIADDARQTAEEILQKLDKKKAPTFGELAKAYSDDAASKENGGDSGVVPLSEPDPEGLIAAASNLEEKQVSGIIEGSNGLYIIKTLEKKDEQIRYARIFIRFTEFEDRFSKLREQGKVHEYIDIPGSPQAIQG